MVRCGRNDGVRRPAGGALRCSGDANPDSDGSPGPSHRAREAEQVVGVLTALLRPEDRATRVADNEFVLIMPAMPQEQALRMAYRIGANFVKASQNNPFLSATATVAVTETRRRPLPIDEIRQALTWAVAEGAPVVTLKTE